MTGPSKHPITRRGDRASSATDIAVSLPVTTAAHVGSADILRYEAGQRSQTTGTMS